MNKQKFRTFGGGGNLSRKTGSQEDKRASYYSQSVGVETSTYKSKAPRNDKTSHAGPSRHPVLDTGSINVDKLALTPTLSHRRGSNSHPELDSGSINADRWKLLNCHPHPTPPPSMGREYSFLTYLPTNLLTKKFAFTLAEVLITLGIIGIVAALTMPSMIAKHNERQTVVKLKHTYSLLNQAINMMILEHGELNQWSDDSKEFFEQELKKQLKVIGEQDCPYFLWNQGLCSNISVNHKYVLNNGVVVGVAGRAANVGVGHTCYLNVIGAINSNGPGIHYGSCANIFVDVNGRTKPNEAGKDTFEFRVYTDGILPRGINNPGNSHSFSDCSSQGGYTCTAWVINHENMDYLHCRDKLNHIHGPYSCKEAAK